MNSKHIVLNRCGVMLLAMLFLSACGGGGGSSSSPAPSAPEPPSQTPTNPNPGGGASPPNPDPGGGAGSSNPDPTPDPDPTPPVVSPTPEVSREEAVVFLSQATFGATDEDIANLQATSYEAWIDNQFTLPVSGHLEYMGILPEPASAAEGQTHRLEAFYNHAVNGEDQLRQRVANALSQIFVVSESGNLSKTPDGLAHYYDLLSNHAFGNFRELMEAVTLNPAMGVYLSMLGNEKPNEVLNIRPDENYARELMQLFTIGLVELNIDGSVVLVGGQPVPTYNQAVIEGFAHVFTGWNFAEAPTFQTRRANFLEPMTANQDFHDTGEKLLLNGVVLPANQTAEQDLEAALDNIFAHKNVAPFISKQLIQRLVTANPSPEFVARVAGVFNNNGNDIKGDLQAVIKAILLDEEARGDNNGKLVEPLNRLIALWRAYDAASDSGRYILREPQAFFAQAPLRAPSVFNFYSPSYAPAGELTRAGLVSPEMQITNETTVATTNDALAFTIFTLHTLNPDREVKSVSIDFTEHLEASEDAAALLDEVSLKLLGTPAPESFRSETIALIEQTPPSNQAGRISEAIHAVATSLEFAVLGD